MADPIAEALEEVAGAQGDLATNIRTLAKGLAAAESRRRREARLYKLILGALLVLALAQAIAVGILINTAGDNRATLVAVQGATGPEAQARSAAGTRKILFDNAVETDCRSRRQQARMPAPDAAPAPPAGLKPDELAKYFARYSCVAQTPPDVYPGTPGQPPKGTP